MCKSKHRFLQVFKRWLYILSKCHFCKNVLNIRLHTTKRTCKRAVGFPCKVSGILFCSFKKHLHCKFCFFSIACRVPFKIDSFFKGVCRQSCGIHCNAQVVHHGKIALRGSGYRFHSHTCVNAHYGCDIGGSLHCLCGKFHCPHLLQARPLEKRPHFICSCHVIRSGKPHIFISGLCKRLNTFRILTKYRFCTAQVLLKLHAQRNG